MFFLIFSSLRYDADAGFETIDGETSQESMCVLSNGGTNAAWTPIKEFRDGKGH